MTTGDDRSERFDVVIKNGHVIDGSGKPRIRANLAVRGHRIQGIGPDLKGDREIDASGMIVSPGFIDMHTHSEYSLLLDPRGLSKVTQGVTTEVLGEHHSAGPVLGKAEDDPILLAYGVERDWATLGEYFERIGQQGIGQNVLSFVGAGQVRACVVGVRYENRPTTDAEMGEMRHLVAQAMDEGAFGVSSGMFYVPSIYASTEELVELAKVAASYGGVYATHLRAGLDGLHEALR